MVRLGTFTVPMQTTRFGPLEVAYDERVLAPRPWTLMQSEWATELSAGLPAGPILELCAGAGHIGLAAAAATGRALVQVEEDDVAARFAQRNAESAGVTAFEVRVVPLSHALGPDERFPLVMADPPYVPSGDVGLFPDDPAAAIDGGPDGLRVIRQCLDIAARSLTAGGACLLQVLGERQADEVGRLLEDTGLRLAGVRSHDADRAIALIVRD